MMQLPNYQKAILLFTALGYPAVLALLSRRTVLSIPFKRCFLYYLPSGLLWAAANYLAWIHPGITTEFARALAPLVFPLITVKILPAQSFSTK
jgi:hypothetical protein